MKGALDDDIKELPDGGCGFDRGTFDPRTTTDD